ncbi:hypothetical protein [Microscilla marina]|uniref:Uncharacterized protein n=1 Tax=Microscilla marina ATCC 23134 TaxID=313606 RepID=A1ZE78_MICM2|nr:hypothetical protein [Microscilla marina]EAY31386.1 hypothetical protein M23134_04219 [Microscilla marina ATCC 23134]
MEEASLNQLSAIESNLTQKGDELWQQYPVANDDLDAESSSETPHFWKHYDRLIDEARQRQLTKSVDKALALAEDVFLSNQQQFKSVPIPLGKYFYKPQGLHPKAKFYVGLGGVWIVNFFALGSGLIPTGVQGWLTLFQLGFGVYIIMKLVNLFAGKTTNDIAIESSYIRDKAHQLMLALKDITAIEETSRGLLVKSTHSAGNQQGQLLVPKNTEEYGNIVQFVKQVVAVNEHQPNIYPDLPSIKAHHWANPIAEIKHERRFIVPKTGMKGIGAMPLEWTGAMVGVIGASVGAISFFGIPMFGMAGILGMIYSLDLFFKNKQRFALHHIHITQEHLVYTFSYNHRLRNIHIPLKEIYGLKRTRRGIKILNQQGKPYWTTLEYPHKKYEPIIPKKNPQALHIQVFLEEVVAHNRGLG